MEDMVEITCYGTTKKMARQKAMNEYWQGVIACEGSERDRYLSIYEGLRNGYKKVDDNWEWSN